MATLPDGLIPFGPDSNCTLDLCPIEWFVYRYRPSRAANGGFLAIYAIAMIVHIILGIRWKSWWFMSFMIAGCMFEIIGYAGRIALWYNPFSFGGFMIQIGEFCLFRWIGLETHQNAPRPR
jgi:hypothetical protein